MKLLTVCCKLEGGPIDRSSIFAVGRCYTTRDGSSQPDGMYFKFESPVARIKRYTSHTTFRPTIGKCRFIFYLRARLAAKIKLQYNIMWGAIDDTFQ